MAQLPPKVPQSSWPPDNISQHHQRMPSMDSLATSQGPSSASSSWVDEFLDFSSSKRGSHRRSVSDSIAFLDQIPMAIEDQRSRRSSAPGSRTSAGSATQFDRFDEEQFVAMFTDDISVGPTVSCSNPSSPSDHNSMDDMDHKRSSTAVLLPRDQQMMQQLRIESEEAESASEGQEATGLASAEDNYNDKIFDPKRIKRILANRQSAQRSRVRKLQYISELERSVNSLQAEVSVLSPRVAFLDHQRLVLNVDNSVLKQRLAALAQDKVFKDGHQEALKREIERLRQVYNYQQHNFKKMEENGGGGATATATPSATKSLLVLQSPDDNKISDHANGSAHKEQIMMMMMIS